MMMITMTNAFETASILGHTLCPRWNASVDLLLGLKYDEILPYTNSLDFIKEWDKEKKQRLRDAQKLIDTGFGNNLIMIPIKMDNYNMGYIVAVTGFRDVRKTFWVLHMSDKKLRLTYCLLPISKCKLAPECHPVRDAVIDYIEGFEGFRDKVKLSIDTQGNFYYLGREYASLDETTIPIQHPKVVFGLLKERDSNPMSNVLLHEIYEDYLDNPGKYAF